MGYSRTREVGVQWEHGWYRAAGGQQEDKAELVNECVACQKLEQDRQQAMQGEKWRMFRRWRSTKNQQLWDWQESWGMTVYGLAASEQLNEAVTTPVWCIEGCALYRCLLTFIFLSSQLTSWKLWEKKPNMLNIHKVSQMRLYLDRFQKSFKLAFCC